MVLSAQPRLVEKQYEFDICYVGLIIGAKGAYINQLRQIEGVQQIILDTRRSPTTCYLIVIALNLSTCEKVYYKVTRSIVKIASTYITASFRKIFIEAKENESQISLSLYDEKQNIPVVVRITDHHQLFFLFERFETPANILENENSNAKVNEGFENLSSDNIADLFEETLSSLQPSENQILGLSMIPGKIVFLGYERKPFEKIFRRSNGLIETNNLKPVFITFLNPLLRDDLFNNLKEQNFYYLNKDEPENFTVVHIYSEVEKKMFSVKLALDENLRQFKDGKEDFRLSDRKKEAIDYVSKAVTIEDFTSGPESDQINYRKLALLLQPESNAYPGAKECFKKLQHAYNAIKEGLPKSTASLEIEKPKDELIGTPPNVISVITNKRKLCTATVFSEAVLDIRTSIVSYENNVDEELPAYISNMLNKNWEGQDAEEAIHTSDGKSRIFIDCIKQITAHHIWVKEIGTFLFEVSVKEMREKFSHQKDWEESIDIHMKLIMDGRDWKKTTAKDLTEEFLKVKEEWNNICPQF